LGVCFFRTAASASRLMSTKPRAVAERTDVVFSMVSNTEALDAIARGPDGVLGGIRTSAVWVEMSTVSPAATRALAAEVAAAGAILLDAPVSGSAVTLDQGQLSFMVGGEAAALERVRAYLLAIGPTITHVGPVGLAVTMKIATNLGLAVQMLAFSEGILLAEKSGIPRATAVDVLSHSVIASPMVQYRSNMVFELPAEAWFDCNMMQKDMLLALELGRQLEVPLPTTAVTNEMLTAARGMGYAKEDFAVLFHTLAKMSGLKTL